MPYYGKDLFYLGDPIERSQFIDFRLRQAVPVLTSH